MDFETEAFVVMEPKKDFKLTPIVLDEVREDELLIEMHYSGICHTDVVLQQGLLPMVDFPAIFGHEGAGRIKEIGSGVKDKSLRVGDAVLLSFNVCGQCQQCTAGHPAYCHIHPQVNHNAVRLEDRSTPARLKDGTSVRSQYFGHSSFARHSVVKERCVVKCSSPDQMPYYAAMGCGFQTGAGTVLNVLKPKKSDVVAIFGLGGVGLSALMAAKYLGIEQVVAIDLLPEKLTLAEQLGATDTINPKEVDDIVQRVREVCGKTGGATFAIDCTGVLKVIEQCIDCVAPCGTAVTVGVPPPEAKISIDPLSFLLQNKRYIGVIEGDSVPKEFIPRLIQLHQQGHFPVEKLCKIYPVSDIERALSDLHAGSVIKPVLQWVHIYEDTSYVQSATAQSLFFYKTSSSPRALFCCQPNLNPGEVKLNKLATMMLLLSLALCGLRLATAAPAAELSFPRRQVGSPAASDRPTNYTVYSFDQPIDHFPGSDRYNPHTNATFSQKYVFDDTYYQPGGPIFLYIGGETDLASRFSNLQTGIIQILMNATSGLGIILENRYYGDSYPFNTSTPEELQFLTTEQTIADNAYFAQNVILENVSDGNNLTASERPWILYGGSLAGAQTAFSLVEYQDILWGGIASSGTIHCVHAYPEWYYPIQKFGPSDCITRINGIVDKMDGLIEQNNTDAIQQLKGIFGLGRLTDIRDFAMTIAFPLGGPMNYPTYTWQELNWYPGYDHRDFFDFCNNITNPDAPGDIISADMLLSNYTNGEAWTGLGGYADYVKNVIVSTCPSEDLIDTTQCFSTQNETFYADTANSAARSYLYTTCIEQGAYQTAPYDPNEPSLLSRVVQIDYTQQWCDWAFGDAVPATGPNLTYCERYGDFNISSPRLAFIDGAQDVWNELCYHGSNATAAHNNLRYGENQYLITGAGHHWDSSGILDISAEPDFIRAAHEWEIRRVRSWIQEWDDAHASGTGRRDEL